jgi:uncharacterized protein (TIRG00374 family)
VKKPGKKTPSERATDDAAPAASHLAPGGVRPEAPRWRAWGVQVALVAGAAILLYLGLASWSDPGQVVAVVRGFSLRAAAVVSGLVVLGLALRAVRWQLYTRILGLGIPAAPSIFAFVAGFAFTATPGKVGEVVKSFLLKRRFDVPLSSTAASLLVERVTDLLAILLLAMVGLARGGLGGGPLALGVEGGSAWLLIAGVLALGFAIAFLANARLRRSMLIVLSRLPGLARLTSALPSLLDSSRQLLTPVPLVAGLALATAAWSCEALALDLILDALGVEVPRAGAFFAFAASSLLGVLSMLPGGLGGFEATMVILLGRIGVTKSIAVAATLLFRLGTLWLVSCLGLLVLASWMLVYGRGESHGGKRVPESRESSGSR